MTTLTTPSDAATCPDWCTDHAMDADGIGWHSTNVIEVGSAELNMSNGTPHNAIGIFGLDCLGEYVSLRNAEAIAFTLLGYVAAARAAEVEQ